MSVSYFRHAAARSLLLVILSWTALAHAVVETQSLDLPTTERGRLWLVGAGDGDWTIGVDVGPARLTRRALDGTVVTEGVAPFLAGTFVGMPDGGIAIAGKAEDDCRIERRDRFNQRMWRRQLGGPCNSIVATGEATWVTRGDAVWRIEGDGSASVRKLGTAYMRIGLPDGGVIASVVGEFNANAIERWDRAGNVLWRRASNGSGGPSVVDVRGDSLYIVSDVPRTVESWNLADGTTRWSRSDAVHGFGTLVAVTVSEGGALVLAHLESSSQPATLHRYRGVDGADDPIAIPANFRCNPRCALLPLRSGGVLLSGYVSGPNSIALHAPASASSFDPPVDVPPLTEAVRLSDGTFRALEQRFDIAAEYTRLRIDGPVPTRSAVSRVLPRSDGVLATAFGVDGSILLAHGAAGERRLSLFNAQGQRAWQAPLDEYAGSIRIAYNTQRACALFGLNDPSRIVVECFDGGDGRRVWRTERIESSDTIAARLLDNGDLLVAVRANGSNSRVLVFNPSGVELANRTPPGKVVSISATGRTLAYDFTDSVRTLYGNSGEVLARIPQDRNAEGRIVTTEQDDTWDLPLVGSEIRARHFDGRGTLLSDGMLFGLFPDSWAASERGLLVYGRFGADNAVGLFDDRGIRWTRRFARTLRVDAYSYAYSVVRIVGDRAFVIQISEDRVVETVLDAEDGRVLSVGQFACERCSTYGPGVDSAGTMRILASNDIAPIIRATLRSPQTADSLDARNVAGAWTNAELPGEGLVATVDADSSTFFAAWFTYASTRSPDTSSLRWYTLQGPTSYVGQATVGIYENTGGQFAGGPATTARRVGTATLRRIGCDHLELEYFGDAPDSFPNGRRVFTRLTDPSNACVGGPVPAPVTGADWRYSGGWFDPARSGQGLMFSVTPLGPVFGAWFTYDPAGAVDDPTTQHWVTMQTASPAEPDGTLRMTLYSTIEGRFDALPAAQTLRIGEATVRFIACDRARFEYRIDASSAAGSLTGRTGAIDLQRVGSCPR